MPGPTPRQQAKADNLERIKRLALDQLAETGATTLSLRAIARELNIVSSAIYRYYPGRDELITDLILDAYTDLAEHLGSASDPRRGARRRFVDTCLAMREWSVAQPHRFALVYGSAIPGYTAPQATIEPAARVVRCFVDAAAPAQESVGATPLPRALRVELRAVGSAFGLPVDEAGQELMLRLVAAFARVVGLLTLELNGHFVGGFEPADALYVALVAREADALGL